MRISFIQNIIEITKKLNKKPSIPYLEINICDHCNLNCAGCDHFCPLVEKETFTDLELFKKDIHELSRKIFIHKIRLMGGEPLLNPQLPEFINITRKLYPKSDIRICTNGILLPTMKEDFWKTLKENHVVVDFSKYPVVGDKFAQYLDLLDDYGIPVGNIHLSKKFAKSYNLNGCSDILETYNNCYSRQCANLWHSKLYLCSACFLEIAKKYWNLDLDTPEPVDFYNLSGKQIVQRLKKPNKACSFCTRINPDVYPWKQSQKEMSEFFHGII